MELTEPMKRDLEKAVRRADKDPRDYVFLRTGRALLARGLVEVGNKYSANRQVGYLPTAKGRAILAAST